MLRFLFFKLLFELAAFEFEGLVLLFDFSQTSYQVFLFQLKFLFGLLQNFGEVLQLLLAELAKVYSFLLYFFFEVIVFLLDSENFLFKLRAKLPQYFFVILLHLLIFDFQILDAAVWGKADFF